ncbi:MAG: nuclear transport factor 2 family protein [Chloroflexota bacterium]|nr:MAG: nuclear transport factor 2 family protein [Chloroflexota bacterium]
MTYRERDPRLHNPNTANDEQQIIKALHDSFGWALTKDRVLFESVFARDDDFFTYFPDSKSTVQGWQQFEKFLEDWMDPRSKANGYNIRNLRLVISKTGDVAWFSALVDDEGEFDGKPWGARDIRWTGVLEKRSGGWKICQQHMSEANDKSSE